MGERRLTSISTGVRMERAGSPYTSTVMVTLHHANPDSSTLFYLAPDEALELAARIIMAVGLLEPIDLQPLMRKVDGSDG